MPDTTTPADAATGVDELRNRITNVRAWLSTNHALTYVPEVYSDGIHALLVHGVDTDGVRPLVKGCRFEDDAVGAAGGPDTADVDELRARIAKVSAWLRTGDALEYVPTEYLIGIQSFLEYGAPANPRTAQPLSTTES